MGQCLLVITEGFFWGGGDKNVLKLIMLMVAQHKIY